MGSAYDPIFPFGEPSADTEDLEAVRGHFAAAARPFLASPWPWLAWGLILPATALASPWIAVRRGVWGVLFLWSLAILVGGVVEIACLRAEGRRRTTALAGRVLRMQGNLSFVGMAVSAALLWQQAAWLLPGLWLLLIGHSFVVLGGLAFVPLRRAGWIYQAAGVLALWPGGRPLVGLAAGTLLANLSMAWAIGRRRR